MKNMSKAGKTAGKVMGEYGAGKLRSGSKAGPVVAGQKRA